MKNVFAIMLSLICAQNLYAQETERLTDDVAPFVYESRAKIPASDSKLAEYLSADYRDVRDEFTKRELLEKLQPTIKSTLAAAKANSEYYLRVRTELGQYDFNSKTFPSGFTISTYIPFGNRYGVMFDNTKDARMMEPSDYMYDIPLKVAGEMTGFNIVSKVRGH